MLKLGTKDDVYSTSEMPFESEWSTMRGMFTQIIYFVHSTTTDNENKLASGWNQGELSAKGLIQAAELREVTQKYSFDIVFCSDLHRAIQTAEIAFGGRFPIEQDMRLRESDYGLMTGGPESEIKHKLAEFIDAPFPDGESLKDVEKRMRSLVEEVQKKYTGKHVAFVGSRAPQLALDVILKSKTWVEAIDEDWRKTGAWQAGWEYTI